MIVILRVVFCFLCLTVASTVYADEALMQSERELQAAYEDAVKIVLAQKPNMLGALEKEQEGWHELREKHCKEANANLPRRYDVKEATDFCKANMNRQRTNVLRGKRPNGKEW